MALVVEQPTDRAALRDLVTFHDEVYRGRGAFWGAFVPFQLPVLTGESPFVADRRFHPLCVRDGERTLARVVAVIDERYQRHWRETIGHLVMFEALPGTREAVRLLMDAACEWLAARGATAARAGSGVLEFPFTIDSYEALPPSWLRQNPAYYHGLLKDAGFETEQGFVDYRIRVRPELVARWESAVEAARRAGYELTPLGDLPASRRAPEFTALWNESFARHWGFTPFSEAEMALLLETFAPVGMLDLSTFAVDRDGVAGGVWVVPDTSAFAARRVRARARAGGAAERARHRRPRARARTRRQHGRRGARLPRARAPRRDARELHARPRRQLALAADGREARRGGVRELRRVPAGAARATVSAAASPRVV